MQFSLPRNYLGNLPIWLLVVEIFCQFFYHFKFNSNKQKRTTTNEETINSINLISCNTILFSGISFFFASKLENKYYYFIIELFSSIAFFLLLLEKKTSWKGKLIIICVELFLFEITLLRLISMSKIDFRFHVLL